MKAYFAGEDLEIDGSTSTSMGTAERRSHCSDRALRS